jgi:hypothetical protein
MDLREIQALHAQYSSQPVTIDIASQVAAMPVLPAPERNDKLSCARMLPQAVRSDARTSDSRNANQMRPCRLSASAFVTPRTLTTPVKTFPGNGASWHPSNAGNHVPYRV